MKRKFLKVSAVFLICLSIGQMFEARKRFERRARFPTGDHTWYEELVASIMSASIAGACIAYDIRMSRRERECADDFKYLRRRSRWRELQELRFVLYVFAISQMISLPIALIRCSIDFLAANKLQSRRSFWSTFPPDALIATSLGIAIIVYDRRRLKKEQWEDTGACMKCGYDLRATPGRCPECGTIPTKRPEPQRASPEKLAAVYDDTDSTPVN